MKGKNCQVKRQAMAAPFLILVLWCGGAYAKQYADKEISAITRQADLILEGTSIEVISMMEAKDGTEFHAIEEDEDLEKMVWDRSWMVTRAFGNPGPWAGAEA